MVFQRRISLQCAMFPAVDPDYVREQLFGSTADNPVEALTYQLLDNNNYPRRKKKVTVAAAQACSKVSGAMQVPKSHL